MEFKIIGPLAQPAIEALEPHVPRVYHNDTAHLLALVELVHDSVMEPGPGSNKKATVFTRIAQLEVPTAAQAEAVREAMLAMYTTRTATGTLDEGNAITLTGATFDLTKESLLAREAARMHVGARAWLDQLEQARLGNPTKADLIHDIDRIAAGLAAMLAATEEEDPS